MILVLIRHGETNFNKEFKIQGLSNNPLNSKGIEQINIVSKKIKENLDKIDFFISSPLKRAIQTADIINSFYDKKTKIILNNKLKERNFGPYEGLDASLIPYYGKYKKGYESNKHIIKRVTREIKKYYYKYKNKTILIASHSHVIKAFLIKYFHNQFNFKTRINNSAYFIIDYENSKNIKILKAG